MFEYINDNDFMAKVDKAHLRTHYAKIVLLTFDEQPIKEIQGTITSGSISVNGSSAVRRTISLSMVANPANSNIESLKNDISLNKKLYIYVGIKNIFPDEKYKKEDILWFPCGLFLVSSASIARGTTGWNISIQGKDKIALLDGTAGGVLPASVTFHEKRIELRNGDVQILYPTIYQIIYEAVNHWGGELIENIIISDLDDKVKMLVKYIGDEPIYFSDEYQSFSFTNQDTDGDGVPDFPNMYTMGEDAGYQETDFTYPGELVLKAGDTIVTLLDKITKTLGNYEYFYDVNGKFNFRQIKNYLNNPSNLWDIEPKDYVRQYTDARQRFLLTDLEGITQVNRNPNFSNIKNDFYVWGVRTTSSDIKVPIRYHLAVDAKPEIDLAGQYMWELTSIVDSTNVELEIKKLQAELEQKQEAVKNDVFLTEGERDQKLFELSQEYEYKVTAVKASLETEVHLRYEYTGDNPNPPVVSGFKATLIGPPCNEWREELYRRGLEANANNGLFNEYYDAELIAEWRNLYDPTNEDWAQYGYWNPDVSQHPERLNYWLDFIDTGAEMGKYSISQIGRRTKVVNDDKIKSIYNKEVPDIVFMNGYDSEMIEHFANIGQKYFLLTPQYYDLFQISTTGVSCFDYIRELLYQNLSYNTTIQITTLPKYYLDVNEIIHVSDRESNIDGDFLITQFTLPLAYNGTMSITATEILTRV